MWFLAFMTALALPVDARGNGEAVRVIDGMIARSGAIVSGRLTVQYRTCVYNAETGGVSSSREPRVCEYSLFAESWAERFPAAKNDNILVNHGGRLLAFARTSPPGVAPRYFLEISEPATIEKAGSFKARSPFRLGTICYLSTLKYLDAHKERARHLGSGEVNGIKVQEIELDVPKSDAASAFYRAIPRLFDGGSLHLNISPELGYVVPRYEYRDLKNDVAFQFDATDFAEVQPGIYLPSSSTCRTFQRTQGRILYKAFDILKSEFINEPVPEDDFVFEIPEGTNVSDTRVPRGSFGFRLHRSLLSSQDISPPKPLEKLHESRSALWGIVLGNLLLVLIVTLLIIRSRTRSAAS